jgi:hypothetical protein
MSGQFVLPADLLVPLEALKVSVEPFARGAWASVFKATVNGVVLCAKVRTSVVSSVSAMCVGQFTCVLLRPAESARAKGSRFV